MRHWSVQRNTAMTMFKTNKVVFRYFNATSLHFQVKEFTEKKKVIENPTEHEGKEQFEKTNTSVKINGDLETSVTKTIRVVLNGQTGAGKAQLETRYWVATDLKRQHLPNHVQKFLRENRQ